MFLGLCFFLALGASWVFLERVVWSRVPDDLIGKWVVIGGEQDGATFDFDRSGAMVGIVNVRGREGRIHAQVSVEGETLYSTTRNPHTGQKETRRQRIQALTRDELILEDERGQVLRMERAE